ncbi:MAG: hypothetical protein WCZ86_12370 [Desulfurivibrionaceae bacterium]|jgi:hypothetical protein
MASLTHPDIIGWPPYFLIEGDKPLAENKQLIDEIMKEDFIFYLIEPWDMIKGKC